MSKWILADTPPNNNRYVLLSFANYPTVEIGSFEADGEGGGVWLNECDKPYNSLNIYVSAWQELPKRYVDGEDTVEPAQMGEREAFDKLLTVMVRNKATSQEYIQSALVSIASSLATIADKMEDKNDKVGK